MELFESTAFHLTQDWWEEENKIAASFSIAADFPAFQGHFPGKPILPGIAQLALITEVLNRTRPHKMILGTIKRVKFLAPILPDMQVCLEIRLDHTGPLWNADAVLSSAGKKFSVMKLSYQEVISCTKKA